MLRVRLIASICLSLPLASGCEEKSPPPSAPSDSASSAAPPSKKGTVVAEKKSAAILPGSPLPGVFPEASCAHAGEHICEVGCARGAMKDCGAAALLSLNGWGTERNLERAKTLAEKGCAEREPMSCGVLAGLHAAGNGMPVDGVKAAELLFFACENGDALSCESLGNMRFNGQLAGADSAQAVNYFLKACDAGHVRACMRAAEAILEAEVETARDVNGLFQKACARGLGRSCSLLGRSLRKGSAAPVDMEAAKKAYDEACRLGETMSCE